MTKITAIFQPFQSKDAKIFDFSQPSGPEFKEVSVINRTSNIAPVTFDACLKSLISAECAQSVKSDTSGLSVKQSL